MTDDEVVDETLKYGLLEVTLAFSLSSVLCDGGINSILFHAGSPA